MLDQTGCVAIVTEGTAGLGFESVLELARKGCHVIFTARNQICGEETISRLKEMLLPSASSNAEYAIADNADLASIEVFASEFLARNLPLNILFLNAGIGFALYREIHGIDSTLFVNHVAHHLLATKLLPVLVRSAPSRVVIVSSGAHASAKTLLSNCLEKPTNIMMGHGLIQHIGSSKVYLNSIHPGIVATEGTQGTIALPQVPWILRLLAAAGFKLICALLGAKTENGVLTQLYVATSQKNEWQGQYFSPVGELDKATPLSRDPEQIERLWGWTNDVIARILNTK
ncbi:hypothetical protein AC1031_005773 [Aphanomyces cochlioides]|nr:hypothetical protein AC1031_005773 [Aphanomyces cochlioides]